MFSQTKKNITFSIHTFGCKVNSYESNIMAEKCMEKGYLKVDFSEKSDICIINTCAVTEESARKSLQFIRRAKRKNPDCVLVVAGCLSQVSDGNIFENVEIIIGSRNKTKIADYIENYFVNNEKFIDVSDLKASCEFENMTSSQNENTRATVKIQDGCDNFCSYCIIPLARGRIRSKSIEASYQEIKTLVENGYKEIVLTGIHLDSYGKETNLFNLCDLLEKIDDIEGLDRIRLGSLEPIFISEENIKKLKNIKHLCPQFHLSLQSGCDATLKRMNRNYTVADFSIAVDRLKANFKNVAITTDVIVGFCGESEEEFNSSLKFIEKMEFSRIHVFPFSPRKGTRAYEMPDQIDNETKKDRSKQILKIAQNSERKFYEKMLGEQFNIIVETFKDGIAEGFTENYIRVKVFCGNNKIEENSLIPVIIKAPENGFCTAELKE